MSPLIAAVVVLITFACLAYGLALLSQITRVRRCPICRVVMRQQFFEDRGSWLCLRCGWSV
jgi:hypothetical protein